MVNKACKGNQWKGSNVLQWFQIQLPSYPGCPPWAVNQQCAQNHTPQLIANSWWTQTLSVTDWWEWIHKHLQIHCLDFDEHPKNKTSHTQTEKITDNRIVGDGVIVEGVPVQFQWPMTISSLVGALTINWRIALPPFSSPGAADWLLRLVLSTVCLAIV